MNQPSRASDTGPDRYETFSSSDDRLQCGSCRAYVTELSPCTWDVSLLVGACCGVDNEPDCKCEQTDVDMFDASRCEYHDDRSSWNVRRREVTVVPQDAYWKQRIGHKTDTGQLREYINMRVGQI